MITGTLILKTATHYTANPKYAGEVITCLLLKCLAQIY